MPRRRTPSGVQIDSARRCASIDDFVALGEEIRRGAALLEEMLAPDRPMWDKADEIKEVEHKLRLPDPRDHPAPAPDLRHAARPRRHPRAGQLARRRHRRHRRRRRPSSGSTSIDQVRPEARELARIIKSCDRPDRRGADGASNAAAASPSRRSRSTASRTRPTASIRTPLQRLFDEETRPHRDHEVEGDLDFLEEATDRCEDVANVVEGVVVKHA